ncbi:PA14 domain-containing protein [Roseovarius sp. Pro17]|uniref:PA14 domain-containing protein n=1 Tax=Roseovarius sp. Pro17 TaxID=3108175 RepID=UPI002D79AA97|nr:PA14 domain-containing protein [Roseovarius sp. Pro17]
MSLFASYFNIAGRVSRLSQIDFGATPTATGMVEQLDTIRERGSFWEGGNSDNFAMLTTGNLNVKEAGTYTLYLTSDDGSALYIDGEPVIDNDGLHGTTTQRVKLDLSAGAHEIEVRYFEARGAATLALEWAGPDSNGERVTISGDSLSHGEHDGGDDGQGNQGSDDDTTGGGDQGDQGSGDDDTAGDQDQGDQGSGDDDTAGDQDQGDQGSDDDDTTGDGGTSGTMQGLASAYFALPSGVSRLSQIDFGATPTATGMVEQLDTIRERGSFWEGGASDNFAMLTTGNLNVKEAGTYTLYLTSDDGSALYIDGEAVVDNDGLHGTTTQRVKVDLSAGAHEIEVRYFEARGAATLALDWAGPDSNGERVTISGDSLSHGGHDAGDDGQGNQGSDDDTTGGGDQGDQGSGDDDTTGHGDHDDQGSDDDDTTGGGDQGDQGSGDDDTTGDGDQGDQGSGDDDTTGGGDQGDQGSGDDDTTGDGDQGDQGSGDDDTTGGGDHGGHGGYSDNYVPTPTNSSEVEAYVAAIRALEDGHSHSDDSGKAMEHMSVLDLVPRSEASNIAINNGDWFDSATWYQGQIPEEGATVLIPEGISVIYDGQSDESLFTVRVDGELSFATDVDTRMEIDTMVVSPSGRLEIGTEENPIQAGVNAEIVIANNGDINTDWDPMLLSRGVVSHGAAEIHGAEKTGFLKVSDAPMAGDTQINLAEAAEGWQVGDTLVLTGTHKQGWTWDSGQGRPVYQETEDEEVVITQINGTTVTIDRPLEHDHDTPRDDLSAYVANTSRNITFSSEDGEDTAVHHRGHVMFMHSDDVDVRYAAFDDLGRTDKSFAAADVETFNSVDSDTNVKGRYAFHFHKTGTENLDDPALAIGNAVNGSPGWGFVHHSSNANFVDNVAFDVFGAAFAAEDGDETGIWSNNMAISSQGAWVGRKDVEDVARHDNGRTGDGFFFAGRLVEASDNVAANTTNGYVWMHRSAPTNPSVDNLEQSELAYGADTVNTANTVIQGFHDNEAFGTRFGLVVIKSNPHQNHDVRSIFDGFTNWETSNGVSIEYTSHYTFLDLDLLGTNNPNAVADAQKAFSLSGNTFDVAVNGATIEGFRTGFDLSQDTFHFGTNGQDYGDHLIDISMRDVGQEYDGFNPARHTILSSDQLTEGRLDFALAGDARISEGEDLYLNGIKTDSIGSRDRQFEGDTQVLKWNYHIAPLIEQEGYYKTADGTNVLLVEDFVSDRATGELHKMSHVITLDISDDRLQSGSIGGQFNGYIEFDNQSADTSDDFARTSAGEDILIDVLANDSHSLGDDLRVDGLSGVPHGSVFLQDDGQLLYRPDPNFTGTDTFQYWAADEDGDFTQGTVTVEVWDDL